MELYNSVIRGVNELLSDASAHKYAYEPAKSWEATKDFELVMAREGAFELGGNGKPAVCFSCVTSSRELVSEDCTCVYGPELNELKGDSAYARITLLRVGDIESDEGGIASVTVAVEMTVAASPAAYSTSV